MAFGHLGSINTLDVNLNRIGDEGAKALVFISGFITLYVSDNQIGE
jgi:Leucine Rich repeat